MFDDCIIMAGGSGTRLWPASNSRRSKQFLPVSTADPSRTFFSDALIRGLAVTAGPSPGRVIIIAGKDHAPRVVSACAALGPGDRDRVLFIVEPEAKNTAPAIAAGVWFAETVPGPATAPAGVPDRLSPDRSILVLTSDHIIGPLEDFLRDAALAEVPARQGKLVVFGIVPSRPETGYGYIEAGEALAGETLAGEGENGVYAVLSFREKPDRARAEDYLAAGRFYWNSGMFAFSTSFMLGEFRRRAPRVLGPFEELRAPGPRAWRVEGGLRILDNWPGFAEAYAKTQALSIDYAIAEKCAALALIPARFSWTDVGNWDEYAKVLGETGAEVYCAASSNCFVDSSIPVALCGVEDLIVVVRSGAEDGGGGNGGDGGKGGLPLVLIAKKGDTQRIREIVEQIRAAGRRDLL
jgi:mannose-1-phosphate guanylyltransferase